MFTQKVRLHPCPSWLDPIILKEMSLPNTFLMQLHKIIYFFNVQLFKDVFVRHVLNYAKNT